jgi:hypothetical protein
VYKVLQAQVQLDHKVIPESKVSPEPQAVLDHKALPEPKALLVFRVSLAQ